MTIFPTTTASATELCLAAARAVGELLADPDTVEAAVRRDVSPLDVPSSAVVADVDGPRVGQVTLVVADSALGAAGIGAAELPGLLDRAVAATGGRVARPATAMEPTLAVNAALADPGASTAVLTVRGAVVAVLGVRVSDEPLVAGPARPAAAGAMKELDPSRLHLLRGVEMAVTAEIGRTRMTVGELLALVEGSVIELDRPAGAPADLLVNGRLIARGEVVVVDENFALRITEIVAADEER